MFGAFLRVSTTSSKVVPNSISDTIKSLPIVNEKQLFLQKNAINNHEDIKIILSNDKIINDYLNDFLLEDEVVEMTTELIKKCKDWNKALELLSNLKEVGIVPSYLGYMATMIVCGECGQDDKVLDLLYDALKSGIFKSSLGYNHSKNSLNLHKSAILQKTNSSGELELPTLLTNAIIRYHTKNKHLNQLTKYTREPC